MYQTQTSGNLPFLSYCTDGRTGVASAMRNAASYTVYLTTRRFSGHLIDCGNTVTRHVKGHGVGATSRKTKARLQWTRCNNCTCILCSLSSLRDMETLGLFMHDLNMYDCSRQMVMAGWQHASRLECSIEKVFVLLFLFLSCQ